VIWLLYGLLAAGAAVWTFVDAQRRMAPRWWTAAAAIGGPLGIAAYFAFRPLREGESREGGSAWQLISKFIVAWTALLALAALWNLAFRFIDLVSLGTLWAAVTVPALAVGLALKRSTVEHGPTGLLRTMGLWYSGPERTPDGNAYICRECGKEYPVTLRFCDGCGAWPGQSG
jgi:hypothetical protein